MKPYRIKHVPTGLYYKPGEVNLTKNGKVYTTGVNAFSYFSHGYIPVSARANSKLHTSTKDVIQWEPTAYYPSRVSARIPIDQFIKEPI
ncbi:MAG: hypothetical protein K2K45_07620 [Muribaculaceae bacterium]|nr:hypothetical protein [Muribaculaceae bacterium]